MSETGFDETPDVTSRLLHDFAAEGLVNIVGGCCGTTPDHIGAIARPSSRCRRAAGSASSSTRKRPRPAEARRVRGRQLIRFAFQPFASRG
jgi:hypothetical protein